MQGELFDIPAWVIVLLVAVNVIFRGYLVVKYSVTVLSRVENLLYLIALVNVGVFYTGVWADIWLFSIGVALSRIVWTWLLVVSLYNSYKMARRSRT